MALLHDQEKVAGVTAFRGIAGFGQSGRGCARRHCSTYPRSSADPRIFRPAGQSGIRARSAEFLYTPGHIVSWSATVNSGDTEDA